MVILLKRRHIVLLVCTPFPAVAIGIYAMHMYNVGIIPIIMNIISCFCCAIGTILSVLNTANREERNPNSIVYAVGVCVLLLILTLLHPGIEGVHRWISITQISLNVALLILPAMIIWIGRLLFDGRNIIALLASAIILCLLFIQPDASQVTAFAVAAAVLLCFTLKRTRSKVAILVLVVIIAVVSWIRLDSLAPFPHVEGILELVGKMGPTWIILGTTSLILLPLPFLLTPSDRPKPIAVSAGIYYIVILLATRFGNFPVPIMGYGISPILGYYIGLTCVLRNAYTV